MPRRLSRFLLSMLLLLSLTSSVRAQDHTEMFIPAPEEPALQWLDAIFPNLFIGVEPGNFSVPSQGTLSVIGQTVQLLNLAIFVGGGLLLIYGIIRGAILTARDGSVFGQRDNETWSAIRVVLGVAALAPVYGGWTAMQVVFAILISWSVGLTGTLWDQAVSAFVSDKIPVSKFVPASAEELRRDVFYSQVCAAAINISASAYEDVKLPVVDIFFLDKTTSIYYPTDEWPEDADRPDAILWGGTDGVISPTVCGGVYFENPEKPGWFETIWAEKNEIFSTGGESVTEGIDKMAATQHLPQAYVTATLRLSNSLRPTAYALAASALRKGENSPPAPEGVRANYEQALKDYSNSIYDEIKVAIAAFHAPDEAAKFEAAVKAGGWTKAGAWYQQIAQINSALYKAANLKPITQAPTLDGAHPDFQEDAGLALMTAQRFIQYIGGVQESRSVSRAANLGYNARGNVHYDGVIDVGGLGVGTKIGSLFDSDFSDWVGEKLDGALQSFVTKDESNPLPELIGLGHVFLDIGIALKTASLVPGAGGLGGMGSVFALAGGALAFVLPLWPFVVWTFNVLRWMVEATVAIIASPIWGLTFLQMSGNELLHASSKQGVMLLAGVLLRPPMMIVGLLMALVMTQISVALVNTAFLTALHGTLGAGAYSLVSLMIYATIFSILYFLLIHFTFSLIYYVPEKVVEWLGAVAERYETGKLENDLRNKTARMS